MPAVSAARKAAFRILLAAERGEAHSDELLRAKSVSALAPADRNLSTALVLGVLRWQIPLDAAIKQHLTRPNAKLDAEILIALRLGAFQLLHLNRVPAHAAIGESVELAKQSGHRFASGMVNAVLRKLSALPAKQRNAQPEEAHSAWMVERWTQFYGADAAHAICEHGQRQPRLSVRIANSEAEAELAQAGIELAPGELLTSARTVVSGDVTATAAFRTAQVRIQDEGSQLIGELAACSSTSPVENTRLILDACAAPGGKTLILAERNPQARIVACEQNPRRLAQLQQRLSSYGERIECRLADAAALAENSVFDLALADVPCSGTGTLGRNPEIRHRLRPEDLPRLAEKQRAILQAVLRSLRPGGSVIYSTCSLEPEENQQMVAAALAEDSQTRQVSLASRMDTLRRGGVLTQNGAAWLAKCLTPEGTLMLLPGDFGTDGFFVALIERMK